MEINAEFFSRCVVYVASCSVPMLEELLKLLRQKIGKLSPVQQDQDGGLKVYFEYIGCFFAVLGERHGESVRCLRLELFQALLQITQQVCFYEQILLPFKVPF